MQSSVHAGGAWCGRKVPGGDFCPQNGYLLWMPKEKCSRLSTQRVPGVDARCQEVSFVHRSGIFCGCRRKMQQPVHKMAFQRGCKVPPQASVSRRGARWLFSLYSQLLYLVALLLGHYKEGDSEFFAAGAKAPYGVG